MPEENLIELIAQQTQEILTTMATKKDLEDFATKDDLEEMEIRICDRVEEMMKKELTTYVDVVDLVARIKTLEDRAGIQR